MIRANGLPHKTECPSIESDCRRLAAKVPKHQKLQISAIIAVGNVREASATATTATTIRACAA